MASGSSAPYGDIIHVLGRPRCGLCCVKKKDQLIILIVWVNLSFDFSKIDDQNLFLKCYHQIFIYLRPNSTSSY